MGLAPAAMLVQLKGMGPEFTAILWSEGLFRSSATEGNWRPTLAWRRHPGRADRSITTGFSKAGNRRLRTTMIQLAWLWLRTSQPRR